MSKGEAVPHLQMSRQQQQRKIEEAQDDFGRRPKRQPPKRCAHRWEYDDATKTHECTYCGEEKA